MEQRGKQKFVRVLALYPPVMHKKLKEEALKQGVSVAELVRRVVGNYLEGK